MRRGVDESYRRSFVGVARNAGGVREFERPDHKLAIAGVVVDAVDVTHSWDIGGYVPQVGDIAYRPLWEWIVTGPPVEALTAGMSHDRGTCAGYSDENPPVPDAHSAVA